MPSGSQHFFGGGGQTDVQPLTLALVIVAIILLFCIPRKYTFIPLVAASVLISLDQQIVVGGVHITMSRLLLAVAWVRLFMVKLQNGSKLVAVWTKLDTAFVAYSVSNVVTFVLLWGFAGGALINRLGFLLNAWGMYFFLRFFLRDRTDLVRATKTLIWVFSIVAVGMVAEQATGKNPFSLLGVSETSAVRDGKIRAQGPFEHPLTAGTIGVALLPLSAGLWWVDTRNKRIAMLGGIVAFSMAFSSRTSTAVMAIAAAISGMLFWRWRRYLRTIRVLVVVVLIALHVAMKAPVWALLSRIDLTGSSSGYHRYLLLDRFISRFSDWWLIGIRTTDGWGWDMWDTINCYVAAGTSGGLLNLVCFLALFVVGFQSIGRRVETVASSQPTLARHVWSMGVLLFTYAVAFFGIAYYDQSQFVWYGNLAMIATALTLKPETNRIDAVVRRSAPILIGNASRPEGRALGGINDSKSSRRLEHATYN